MRLEIPPARNGGILMQAQKALYNFFYKPLLKIYLRFEVSMRYDGFKLRIMPGVFHPAFFFSTKYFYAFINHLELKGLHFLEIGSGSGLLSLLALRKGAVVTALDVDPKAIENTQLNFRLNFTAPYNATVIQSNLLSQMPVRPVDVIVINPPFFFRKVENNSQLAWYCGKNGEYFENLFLQIAPYVRNSCLIFMILADNCDIERIKSIAAKREICFNLVDQGKIKWEMNFIYKLQRA